MSARDKHQASTLDFGGRKIPLDTVLAQALGVDQAIFIQQLHFLMGTVQDDPKHRFKGFVWVYNTYEQWLTYLPFWKKRKLEELIKALERDGIVLSRQQENSSFRVKYYTIDMEQLKRSVQGRLDSTDSVACMEQEMHDEDGSLCSTNNPEVVASNPQFSGASIQRDINYSEMTPNGNRFQAVICNE